MKTFSDRSRGTETWFPTERKKNAPQQRSQAAWPQGTGEPGGSPVSMCWPGSWGGSRISHTGTDLRCDFVQIRQHGAVPWETPKKHHQSCCIALSRLACPAPLKQGWIIVVTVPPALQLAQAPLQSQHYVDHPGVCVGSENKTLAYLQGTFWS